MRTPVGSRAQSALGGRKRTLAVSAEGQTAVRDLPLAVVSLEGDPVVVADNRRWEVVLDFRFAAHGRHVPYSGTLNLDRLQGPTHAFHPRCPQLVQSRCLLRGARLPLLRRRAFRPLIPLDVV